MKELELFLKTVVDGMKSMAKGIEVLADKLDSIAKSQMKAKTKPARKAKAKPKKKPVAKKKKSATAVDTV